MGAGKPIVLIVDDQETNRTVLEGMVGGLGYFPVLASNGREGLEKISSKNPDLILLDILMPEMDGFQMLEKIKSDSHRKAIPVVMVSALSSTETIVRCVKLGADDYLVKPFEVKKLKEVLDRIFSTKPKSLNLGEIKVLIIDESETVRGVWKNVLRKLRFSSSNLFEADNAEAGSKLFKNVKPQIVICNREMGKGSGMELLSLVRTDPTLNKIPFLMTSSNKETDKIVEAVLAGVSQFLIKPFTSNLMEQKVKQLIDILEKLDLEPEKNNTGRLK